MTATAASNLPSIDQWMVLRAKLAAVLGDEPASTLLSVLPSPIDGGFASNGRLDLMEPRLRADLAATNGRIEAAESRLRADLATTNGRIDAVEMALRADLAATNGRIDAAESRLRADLAATDGRIDAVESRLRADLEVVESRLRTEIVQASADTLKSMRALFFQLVGVMCTLGGFAIAAAKLL